MTINKNIIITAIISIAAGLGIGFLVFNNNAETNENDSVIGMEAESSQSSVESEKIWTCSMHPQIRQNEPGLCPICAMDLIPLEENTSNDPLVLKMTDQAVKLANIQTTVLKKASNSSINTLRLSGKIKADERLSASQVAHVPGRIEKLFVTFTGEYVKKGQKLATIYSPQLITAQREFLEAKKLIDINPDLLEASRNKLKYWKIDSLTIDDLENKGQLKENFTIYADQSGVVTKKMIAVGDYLALGEPLFELINLNSVWVLFDAYEDDLSKISIGDEITFTTPSVQGHTFSSRISFIDPIINPITRVASLRTEVRNTKGLLKPEMFVTGIIKSRKVDSANILVPKSAVLWTGSRSVVYVKEPNTTIPSFRYKEVKLGEGVGDSYQLLDGLEVGEEVVTYGNFTIDAAAQLNNQSSMINRKVSVKEEKQNLVLPDFRASTPLPFKKQISHTSNHYITLKDALVNTDKEKATMATNQLLTSIEEIDKELLKDEPLELWMEQYEALISHSKQIIEGDNIEDQRFQFDFLSQALIKTIKIFGLAEDTLFVEHCPMALDNKGADWLSSESVIRNPYFGDKMLKCGVVKDTLSALLEPSSDSPLNQHNH